jgi:photosystem II stability/assembly factor-like uncharacterized protein
MYARIIVLCCCFHCLFGCQYRRGVPQPMTTNTEATATETVQQKPYKVWKSASKIVFQSTDNGQTWQDVSAGLPEGVEIGCIYAGGGEVFLGFENGLFRSVANSGTPIWKPELLLDHRITGIIPGQAGLYACSNGRGFFQELSGTGVWLPMHKALEDQSVYTVLETADGTVFIGSNSGITTSTNGGKTWKGVFDEAVVTNLITVNGVLLGTASRGVIRSTDGGVHWDWVLTNSGAAVAIDRTKGGLGAITYDGGKQQFYTSKDSGSTWQQMDDNALPFRFSSDIKAAGDYLFVSEATGILRSSDQGNTWELVFPSKDNSMFNFVVSGKVIFAIPLGGC